MGKNYSKKFKICAEAAEKNGYKTYIGKTNKDIQCLLVSKLGEHTIDAYVLFENNLVCVGKLVLGFDNDDTSTIFLSTLVVKQDFQNNGIGSFMMKYFIKLAKQLDYSTIQITCFKKHINFLNRFGFEAKNLESQVVEMNLPLLNNEANNNL